MLAQGRLVNAATAIAAIPPFIRTLPTSSQLAGDRVLALLGVHHAAARPASSCSSDLKQFGWYRLSPDLSELKGGVPTHAAFLIQKRRVVVMPHSRGTVELIKR